MEFGPLVIDEDSAEVSMDGAPVDLTPKEYQLLCLLADNPGTALSREDIRRALWKDSKIYSWSRVIDVHVQHLRQKVEPDPAEPRWIKTIVGRGYRFDPEGE
jgi:DNA-binding response OmpR family regulator